MAMKFTFLFLNLAKIHIFIPKCTEGEGGGSTGLGNIAKKTCFFTASLHLKYEGKGSARFCRLNYALGGFVFAIGGGSALWRGKATYRSPLDEALSA